MVYRTCSINQLIAQIYRDFKPSHSGWVEDAIEWVGDAIGIMKVYQGYTEVAKQVEVIDYRAKLPCDTEQLFGIEYNGKRLPKSGGVNHKNSVCSGLTNLVIAVDESYSLNPNYAHTTFKTGCVTFYYHGIEVDCDGYPMIIDDPLYRNALKWYVMMVMCGRGFKHQVFDYKSSKMEWESAFPKAQNRCRMPDIDDYEVFKKSWLGLARSTNMTNEFFNTVVNTTGTSNSNAYPPGSLVSTFNLLGNNTNNE